LTESLSWHNLALSNTPKMRNGDGMKKSVEVTWRAEEGWPSTSEIFTANADGSHEVQLTGD